MYSVLEDRTDSFWRVRRGGEERERQEGEKEGGQERTGGTRGKGGSG
jgi:hypothetical protein